MSDQQLTLEIHGPASMRPAGLVGGGWGVTKWGLLTWGQLNFVASSLAGSVAWEIRETKMTEPLRKTKGDTASTVLQLIHVNGTPFDLSDTVSLLLQAQDRANIAAGFVFEKILTPPFVDPLNGKVVVDWVIGDVDIVRVMLVEAEATQTDTTIVKFPNRGKGLMIVQEELH